MSHSSLDGQRRAVTARSGAKTREPGRFCVKSGSYPPSQESSLESLETVSAGGERAPGLRSPREDSNIRHPSQTGPLPAAA